MRHMSRTKDCCPVVTCIFHWEQNWPFSELGLTDFALTLCYVLMQLCLFNVFTPAVYLCELGHIIIYVAFIGIASRLEDMHSGMSVLMMKNGIWGLNLWLEGWGRQVHFGMSVDELNKCKWMVFWWEGSQATWHFFTALTISAYQTECWESLGHSLRKLAWLVVILDVYVDVASSTFSTSVRLLKSTV